MADAIFSSNTKTKALSLISKVNNVSNDIERAMALASKVKAR